jgi:hypothetical protein
MGRTKDARDKPYLFIETYNSTYYLPLAPSSSFNNKEKNAKSFFILLLSQYCARKCCVIKEK